MLRFLRVVLTALACALAPASAADATHYVPDLDYRVIAEESDRADPLAVLDSDAWRPVEQASPNFGYDQRVFWFRFRPRMEAEESVERLISIGYPQLDDVRFYLLRDGRVVDQLITGDRRPYVERAVHHPHFLWFIALFRSRCNRSTTIRCWSGWSARAPSRCRWKSGPRWSCSSA